MDANSVLDHGLGQLLRLGRAGSYRRIAWFPAGSGRYLPDEPGRYYSCIFDELASNYSLISGIRGPALAPVLDLRCLQPRRICDQQSHEPNPSPLQQGCL